MRTRRKRGKDDVEEGDIPLSLELTAAGRTRA